MEQVAITLQDMRAEIRSLNTRIDRLTLAILGIGGGVIVALISLVGVLAARITSRWLSWVSAAGSSSP
jgi:uncharacterized membrane protein